MKLPAKGELDLDQSIDFLHQLIQFEGRPPVLIMTGGDVMKKQHLPEIMEQARSLKIPFALSPAVTGLRNDGAFELVRNSGASSISISLDGRKDFHDFIRGTGVFDSTLKILGLREDIGVSMQVNTLVSSDNIKDLPLVLRILLDLG
ncbi:coenzyme PQQ synthesis protein related protein, partial [mine drainage metagenome]